jgi:hypothetical protein
LKRLIIENYLFFKALSTFSEVFLCYIDIWFLTPNYSSTTTTNWRSFNRNTWNQRKVSYSTTRHQGLRPKIIDFGWIYHRQWNEESKNIRKPYYLVSSHVKPLNAKLRGQRFLKEGTML